MPTQNFITVDSVLKLDSKWLSIQKIRKDPDQSYWLHSFLLLALFIAFQVHRTLNGEYVAWVIIDKINKKFPIWEIRYSDSPFA